MSKDVVLTQQAPLPIGPYSQAVTVQGTLVFTAGQVPLRPSGEVVAGDITVQTRQVLDNLKAVLEASGSNLASVVKTTVFLKDLADFGAMNAVYADYFIQTPPARTTVEVSRLPKDAKVEIDAVALVIKR